LEQAHGTTVVRYGDSEMSGEADAVIATAPLQPCAVLSADCLPVLFTDRAGRQVAAAHAGWRGLAAGILERTVAAMDCDPAQILAWLGPAIGPRHFQVGDEVREAFIAVSAQAGTAFVADGDRWRADLYALAGQRLAASGVKRVFGGGLCTFGDAERFFSYRRDGVTGRMASLIWIEDGAFET
jgi:YfiH family protein